VDNLLQVDCRESIDIHVALDEFVQLRSTLGRTPELTLDGLQVGGVNNFFLSQKFELQKKRIESIGVVMRYSSCEGAEKGDAPLMSGVFWLPMSRVFQSGDRSDDIVDGPSEWAHDFLK